ncbi:MAG: DsbA family protein [Patescibacteria group bacterium]|jgi:hypothetical protein
MFCIIALIIFAILGIFSASHRLLAKEALDCVLRRVTLRPCNTGFKEKIQAKILGQLINRSVRLTKFVNRYFEVLAWIFFILMVASTVYVMRGGYNFYMYGNCNGLNEAGFCVFDPTGANNQTTPINESCSLTPPSAKDLRFDVLKLTDFPQVTANTEKAVVFIGCYSCDATRKTYPTIRKLLANNTTNFTFIHFPIKPELNFLSNYTYCINKIAPNKLWEFNDAMFAAPVNNLTDKNYVNSVIQQIGLDANAIEQCVNDPETQKIVDDQFQQVVATNIYGTPTTFVNGQAIVGPKPYRVYQRLLSGGMFAEIRDYFARLTK